MNTFVAREEVRVRVALNDTAVAGLKPGEPALFIEPARKLFEEPSSFLRNHYVESGTRTSPNTWAAAGYALQSWFEFLFAWGVTDWRDASRDDLIAYRDGYATSISPKTGALYSSGTIGNRMMVVLAYYKYAGRRGWYTGDLLVDVAANQVAQQLPLDEIPLAHARRGVRTAETVSGLVPKRRQSRTAIRPFSISELRTALPVAGPRATERVSADQRPARDRLMFDLGWAVGLRLDEINQLTKLTNRAVI